MGFFMKGASRPCAKMVLFIFTVVWIVVNTASSSAATDLKENNKELKQQMEKVFKARAGCSEICASIPVETDNFFLANSAREILSVIVIRLKYEWQMFEMLEYIQDSHKKTETEKRINSYATVREIVFKEIQDYRKTVEFIKEDNVLYYFDEAEEAILRAMKLFDNRIHLLKAEL